MKINAINKLIKELKEMKKKGLSAGTIKGTMIVLIFLVVLLSMLPNLIHTSAEKVQVLSTEFSNSTLYGEGAASIGSQLDDWTGYFWVVGPLVMLISVILGIFMYRRTH